MRLVPPDLTSRASAIDGKVGQFTPGPSKLSSCLSVRGARLDTCFFQCDGLSGVVRMGILGALWNGGAA